MSSFSRAVPASASGGFWSIERVVALLTPVFAIAAGALSTGIGSVVGIPAPDFVALFVAGGTAATGGALKWLHGRQKFVNFVDDAEKVAESVIAKIKADQLAGPALTDIESILRAHTGQIVDYIGKNLHLPPTADEVAKQILKEAAGGGAPVAAAVAGNTGAAEQGAAVTGS